MIRSLGKGTLRDHKQETLKEAVNELEMSVSKLSRENEEMKKLVSCLRQQNNEMKEAVLELCSHSRRQERVILKLAQKLGIESDPVKINWETLSTISWNTAAVIIMNVIFAVEYVIVHAWYSYFYVIKFWVNYTKLCIHACTRHHV